MNYVMFASFLLHPAPIKVCACQWQTNDLLGFDATTLLKIEWIYPCWLEGYAEYAEYANYLNMQNMQNMSSIQNMQNMQNMQTVKAVNAWVRSTFGNVCVNISKELLVWYFRNPIMW